MDWSAFFAGFGIGKALEGAPAIIGTIFFALLIALGLGVVVAEIIAQVTENADKRRLAIPISLIAIIPVFILFWFI